MSDFKANVEPRPAPRATPAIQKDQIDLWSADLDADGHSEERAYTLLSPDERGRAQRFRFSVDRRRYIIRRGVLRILLGRYLDVAPGSISFSYGPHGKPVLSEEVLHFNMSHSGSQACFAFSLGSPLGIDFERVRPMPDLLHVAAGFCSSAELAALKSLKAGDRLQAFFRCWTRKEALVKALGLGLSCPLENISVSLDVTARLLDVRPQQEELMLWHFHPWEPGPEYLGAIVSRHPDSRIVSHRFTEHQE